MAVDAAALHGPRRGWMPIEDKIFASAGQTHDFTVNGDAFRFLRLLAHIVNGTAATRLFALRLNAATTNITFSRILGDANAAPVDDLSAPIAALASASGYGEVLIPSRSGTARIGKVVAMFPAGNINASTTGFVSLSSVAWNSTDVISQIGLSGDAANAFGVGSYLRLEGCR